MYNKNFSLNNIRTDSEIHKLINSKFRNYRLRLEWPLCAENPVFEIVPRDREGLYNGNVQ